MWAPGCGRSNSGSNPDILLDIVRKSKNPGSDYGNLGTKKDFKICLNSFLGKIKLTRAHIFSKFFAKTGLVYSSTKNLGISGAATVETKQMDY